SLALTGTDKINIMTILEALQWAEGKLRGNKENPKLDAQVILAHVISRGTAYLFAHSEDPLTTTHIEQFQRLVERRVRHEPVAYLVGHKEFYGREFTVNPHVLIPRPDTETMVDLAKTVIAPTSLIIDVGTGSGAVALTLAAETGRPAVAIDLSSSALTVAKLNAESLKLTHLVAFFEGDLLTPLLDESHGESLGPHAVITANLPYISNRQYEGLDPNVKAYEPRLALVSGIDGLDHYDQLFSQISAHRHILPAKLDVLIEIDPSQRLSAHALVKSHLPHATVTLHNDLTGRARVIHVTI
ncbi:TPA: peptide chain release factor N(5)-glutamine methyltransferase, partial [Candidatus Uhrbacteria bacterium]|nr:peptide chain release factor N(5)-glutamine methyltransferase [Candidatus Uhrbacteria bacterium]